MHIHNEAEFGHIYTEDLYLQLVCIMFGTMFEI